MASFDKIVKYLVDTLQGGLAPLIDIRKNQEILIIQNKQIISLLEQIRTRDAGGEAVENQDACDTTSQTETV